MATAYSYVRFSTPEQLKGDSLRRQTEMSERYARDHGLVLDESLSLKDMGVSAYSGEHRDRGALGQFLKLIEAGKIEKGSVLLVESFDRLSREQITSALQQFLNIIGKGIKIVTLLDNREYTQETVNANVGELIVSLTIMSRAHEESATKGRRLSEAWEGKRKQTDKKLTAKAPAWLTLNKARTEFTVIEDRGAVIRRIFNLKLAGKGATAIVKELNTTPGIWKPGTTNKLKKGEGWRESYIKKILQNRSVIGEFQPHRLIDGKRQPVGDPIPDYFPAVIDKDVFYRAQSQIKSLIHKGGLTGKVTNLFPYLAKCGICGSSMATVDHGPPPKGGRYLVCDRSRRRNSDCHSSPIKYDDFELLILTHCKGLQPADLLNENDDTAITLLRDELDGKTGELDAISAEIDNLTDSIAMTADTRVRAKLNQRMLEKFDKQGELTKQIDDLKKQIDTQSRSLEDTQTTLDSLKELLDFLSTAEPQKRIEMRLKLRTEIRKLITRIDVFPEGHPRWTIDAAKKALKDMAKALPRRDVESLARLEKHLQKRVEHPKDFSACRIQFTSGSYRFIVGQMAAELDKKERIFRIWNTNKNGQITCEEYNITLGYCAPRQRPPRSPFLPAPVP